MVCGTTSGAGKSFLATALARWYARQGLKVAPFKAQNMSNNARVAAGGEMGSAQYLQALAARAVPDVRMNPILLKPESDTASQVILLGERRDDLTRMEWRSRAMLLWPTVKGCLDELLEGHDVVVIEGAGSPAEINLQSTDIVNLRVAEACAAAALIVCDIDRGGAFAHLYGTVELLPPAQRALVRGFVLNKFRGDERLLAPGPQRLEQLTGIPTVAVLPMWREHGLPEEDGVYDARPSGSGLSIAVIAYPYISNLDEFTPLKNIPGVSLSWAREPQTVASADLLVLPGSKHVAADLGWLRRRGLDAAVAAHAAADKPLLAICGGLQMLGERLDDPYGVEGDARGLGMMPYRTTSGAGKSFLATALARWYARQGLKVAPFKAQNMSNNARVAAGGEMGSAQYLQALAARAVPDVRMNPILLKPESDTASQVILLGERRDDLARMEWRRARRSCGRR